MPCPKWCAAVERPVPHQHFIHSALIGSHSHPYEVEHPHSHPPFGSDWRHLRGEEATDAAT